MERETSALMTGAEATASYPQVPAIPDVNIVLGEAAEPAQALRPGRRDRLAGDAQFAIALAEASSSGPRSRRSRSPFRTSGCAAMPV